MSGVFRTTILAAAAVAGSENLAAQYTPPLKAELGKTCTETYGVKPDKQIRSVGNDHHIYGKADSVRAKIIAACEVFEATNAKLKKKYAPAAELMKQIVHTIGESEISPNVDESGFKKPFDKVAFEKAVKDFVEGGAHLLVFNQAREKFEDRGLERRPMADLSTALGNASSPYENPSRSPRKELSGSAAILYLLRTLNRLGIDIADERYPAIENMKEKLEAMKTALRAGIAELECSQSQPDAPKQGARGGPRVSKDWLATACAATGAVR